MINSFLSIDDSLDESKLNKPLGHVVILYVLDAILDLVESMTNHQLRVAQIHNRVMRRSVQYKLFDDGLISFR